MSTTRGSFESAIGYAVWPRSPIVTSCVTDAGTKSLRTTPVIATPPSLVTGAVKCTSRASVSGTSHCQPIHATVKPRFSKKPSPMSASVSGSSDATAARPR
ncbi:MAG: hypothetical protein ABR591_10450 [Candidatus Velthaea sp.]